MQAREPHYLLFSTAPGSRESARQWRFVLQPVGGEASLAVADVEEDAKPGRLELLAVVRGLEALAQPSRVTLVTDSRYVVRGIRHGLSQWRERGWRWERFGQIVPIRDDDLWRRVDRAMQFHQIECRDWPQDSSRASAAPAETAAVSPAESGAQPPTSICAATAPGCEFSDEPALVIVPRPACRRAARAATRRRFAAAFERLRSAVMNQLGAVSRPACTPAA